MTCHSSAADLLLVMPQRKAPSERLQRAAAEAAGVELADEDEDALRFSIRPDAWAWEKWLGRFLQVGKQLPAVLGKRSLGDVCYSAGYFHR